MFLYATNTVENPYQNIIRDNPELDPDRRTRLFRDSGKTDFDTAGRIKIPYKSMH